MTRSSWHHGSRRIAAHPETKLATVATLWPAMKRIGSVKTNGQTLGARAAQKLQATSSARSISWTKFFAGSQAKNSFQILKMIVVAGHSAGGQFITRYEMLNQVHDKLGIPISYVVANPSAYAYVDSLRPTASAFPTTASATAQGSPASSSSSPSPAFLSFADAKNCTGYDIWPYGLKGRTGYASALTNEQITQQLVARPVTYLLGEADVLPLGVFDTSCPAMAQGPTRLGRGLAFHRYVNENLHAHHNLVVVPFCSHSQRCMFTSDVALPLIFPK